MEIYRKFTVVLLDIEGTTTSISFVKDTLFPYARQHVSEYLTAHWDDPETKSIVNNLIQQSLEDDTSDKSVAIDKNTTTEELKLAVVRYILWQMDRDLKTTPLKQLQGLIWQEAYVTGQISGHVYEDVLEVLKSWNNSGKNAYIYSSGSVQAQKLLFGHSTYGDLTSLLHGYFDANIGPKISSASYTSICKNIDVPPQDVLFLTDVPKEAYAAKEAGLQVVLVTRPGNADLSDTDKQTFDVIHSFEQLVTSEKSDLKS